MPALPHVAFSRYVPATAATHRSHPASRTMPVHLRCFLLPVLLLSACQDAPRQYDIVKVLPHDPGAYTQGLLVQGETIFESTGLNGRSSVRKVRVGTGEVVQHRPLSNEYFGEGLALVDDRLIQLTWHQGRAFVYDTTDLQHLDTFVYEGEGWGLCYDGNTLYMSNGSEYLTRRDPLTFAVLDSVRVTMDGGPLSQINELECARGEVFANIYTSDWIVRINPRSGVVTAAYSLADLVRDSGRPPTRDAVLNGIAYDSISDTFLVTGKLWPRMFRIRLHPQN